jgi:hypothetical protein
MASAGLGVAAGMGSGLLAGQTAPHQPAEQPAADQELEEERRELLGALVPDDTATQPASTSATQPPDQEVLDLQPTERPRFIFVDGEWVETTTPAPEEQPAQAPVAQPAPPVAPEPGPATEPGPPAPVEPQIDWSRVAGEEEYRIIRISAAGLRDGDFRQNIVVRPNDSIRLMAGETGEYYIMGQVFRPGAYSITGRQVTLKTAVAAAGNLGPLAWPERCTIYRRYGDREEMHQVNLDAIFAGKEPDVFLKNNDLVLVGTHPAASFLAVFRNAFRMTYGFGFVYDRNFADIDSFTAQPNPAFRDINRGLFR